MAKKQTDRPQGECSQKQLLGLIEKRQTAVEWINDVLQWNRSGQMDKEAVHVALCNAKQCIASTETETVCAWKTVEQRDISIDYLKQKVSALETENKRRWLTEEALTESCKCIRQLAFLFDEDGNLHEHNEKQRSISLEAVKLFPEDWKQFAKTLIDQRTRSDASVNQKKKTT